MPPRNWSATESRIIEPYAQSHRSLSNVAFRLSNSVSFSLVDAYWLEAGDLPSPFLPELLLAVDKDALERESHLSIDDLRLVIALRDRASHRWEALATFTLEDAPEQYFFSQDQLQDFAIARRLEFVVLVVPKYGLPRTPGRAYLPQHVVATRAYHVNLQREGSRFPVRERDAAWFIEHGFPEDTVWTIDWKLRSPDATPPEALDIIVNKKYAESFRKAIGDGDVQVALSHQIVSEIFAEVALVAIRQSDEWIKDPETLLGTVLGSLEVKSEEEYRRFKDLVGDPMEALPKLRAFAQAALELGKALGRA